jgi:hypothetical protein
MKEAEIYCPHCEYRPQAHDRWVCVSSCATVWNTFWTRGVCPGCGTRWPQTQCLECHEWSPHEAWYHYPPEHERDVSTEREQALTAATSAGAARPAGAGVTGTRGR